MNYLQRILKSVIVVISSIVLVLFCIYFYQNELRGNRTSYNQTITKETRDAEKIVQASIMTPQKSSKYYPFTPGKKGYLRVNTNATIKWPFLPYEGIPKENISRYENRIVGKNETFIVNKGVNDQKVLVFGGEGDLKLSPGNYTWYVNVITNQGEVIEGEISRSIEVVR